MAEPKSMGWRVGLALVLLLLSENPASAQESPAERLAAIVKKDAESIKSIEVRVRTDFVMPKPDLKQINMAEFVTDHYIETKDGGRYNENLGMRDDRPISRNVSWGLKDQYAHAMYAGDNPQRQIQFHFLKTFWQEDRAEHRWVPTPLKFRYVGAKPLHEALVSGEHLGPSEVLGRPCERFMFPAVKWMVVQDHIFHADRETGLTLKVESFRNAEAREAGDAMWTWTAEEIATHQGHPVVMKSSTLIPASERDVERRWRFTVESVKFDETYPEARFTPTIGPGVTIIGIDGQPVLSPR